MPDIGIDSEGVSGRHLRIWDGSPEAVSSAEEIRSSEATGVSPTRGFRQTEKSFESCPVGPGRPRSRGGRKSREIADALSRFDSDLEFAIWD
jgi:hypothetical protein